MSSYDTAIYFDSNGNDLVVDNGGVITVKSGGSINLPGGALSASATLTTNAATSGTTLTAANISGGSNDTVLNMTGTLGAGANAQLPTAANLVAALANATLPFSYILRIVNSSAANFPWTVTANTGWTLGGSMTIAQNTWREFVVTLNSSTAATLQTIGTGAAS